MEPGPIHRICQEEIHYQPGIPAPARDERYIRGAEVFGRWSYPSVLVLKDRVLIAHTYTIYEDHPTRAVMEMSSRKEGTFNQKLKVLPLPWFYGGKEPADNPFLPRDYEPAQP